MIGPVRRLEPGVAPAAQAIAPGEVQIWRADLDDPHWSVDELAALLAPEEHARRALLRTETLRRRFTVRRGVLRLLLGACLGASPAGLRFGSTGRGKPALLDAGPEPPQFNLADCEACALYALSRAGPVGVDVEAVIPLSDLELVARRWFSADERAALARLPEPQRPLGFYLGWTRKEAMVKAEGTGIGMPLERFSVSLTPGEPAQLLGGDLPALRGFALFDLPLEAPFVAACAVWGGGGDKGP